MSYLAPYDLLDVRVAKKIRKRNKPKTKMDAKQDQLTPRENATINSRNRHLSFWQKNSEVLMPRLTAYAMRLVNGRRYDAEDLVQETVFRFLMYPPNPEGIRNHLVYLLTIMRRIWITNWRLKEGAARTESLDELLSKEVLEESHRSIEPAVEPDVFRVLENTELRDELRLIQSRLTSREKELLKLYLGGYTVKEIADKLNEDVRLVLPDLNAMRTKVISRLMKKNRKN